jgi:hypothetical protein
MIIPSAALNTATGRTFAAPMPISSAQRKPVDSTANETIGAGWKISRIFMMMYMKDSGKQTLQNN